jgi:hypothetical protein
MAEARKVDGKHALKVPDFLKDPIEAAQVRLGQLEDEAQRVLKDLMLKGRAGRHDIEQIVHKIARQDWTFPEMKLLLEKLREQGVERAAELKGKAKSVRADALERMVELQGKVVAFLGVATREQVEELSRELERLARRIERGQQPRRPTKKGTKPSDQV